MPPVGTSGWHGPSPSVKTRQSVSVHRSRLVPPEGFTPKPGQFWTEINAIRIYLDQRYFLSTGGAGRGDGAGQLFASIKRKFKSWRVITNDRTGRSN